MKALPWLLWPPSASQAEIFEDVIGHGGGLHLCVDLFELAFGINNKGVAHHAHVFTAHELLEAVALIGGGHWAWLAIAEQGEGQAVFIDELCVAFGVVFADAQHLDVMAFEAVPLITEVAGFLGAPRGVVFRIEIDDHPLTAQIFQCNGLAVLIRKGEIGCGITDLKGHGCNAIGA